MSRRLLTAACLLLAGCDKYDSPAAGSVSAGRVLEAAPMQAFPSYESFCATVIKGACQGEWAKYPGGKSTLGDYRFVVVEYPTPRDKQGPARDVMLELKTPRGVAYRLLGRLREGAVANSLRVMEVVDHHDALELRLVSRTAPRMTYSDYYSSTFIMPMRDGAAAVEVSLGKIVGDIDTGATSGNVGSAKWEGKKLSVKGATVADGVWEVAAR